MLQTTATLPTILLCVQDSAGEGDTSAAHHCARGLAGLQARFGAFASIKGAGPAALAVADILQRMRQELGTDAPPVGDHSALWFSAHLRGCQHVRANVTAACQATRLPQAPVREPCQATGSFDRAQQLAAACLRCCLLQRARRQALASCWTVRWTRSRPCACS